MGQFCGFVALGDTLIVEFLAAASNVPVQATGTPAWRVYVDGTFLVGGNASSQETFAITGATNASPIVLTTTGTPPATGMKVTVASVGGTTAANGTFTATFASSTTFSLDGSTGNGAYTSGGTWTLTGIYPISVACTEGNGFEQGKTYTLLVEAVVSGSTKAETYTFTVV